ncbi:hypothetical protein JCM3774_000023 [Rhodotorula dairenensis]
MAPIYERVQQVSDEEQSKRDFDAKEDDISLRSADAATMHKLTSTSTHGAYKSALARAALVTGTVAVVALALSTLCAGGFDSFAGGGGGKDVERRRVKRADPVDDKPKYSSLTTTDSQGEPSTQSFVYTTRPIVNPGGYTIGTLTGYVQLTATPTNATSTGPTSMATPTVSASEVETTTTTNSPIATPWAFRDASEDADGVATTTTAARLVRRAGVVEEDDEAPPPPSSTTTNDAVADAPTVTEAPSTIVASAAAAADEAEYSTSTDRAGSVYTLVKTTRPIVNPGGYTIGTLDGAWVDVAKQTSRPAASSATNRKKRAASPAAPVPQMQQHDELRRRNIVDLAAAAAA